jgi:hypothetical protein
MSVEKKDEIEEFSVKPKSAEEIIKLLVQGSVAAKKGGKGLGQIVIALVAKAKEKNIPFNFDEIWGEIRDFQGENIKQGRGMLIGTEIEDMHTFFCVAPIIKEQIEKIVGFQNFERIKNELEAKQKDL